MSDFIAVCVSIYSPNNTYKFTSKVPDDFFDGHWGSNYHEEILKDMMCEEDISMDVDNILDWEIIPAG